MVTGGMKMGPTTFSRNMVVLREGERLVLVNTMRLGDEGLAALDALGKVTDVIRLAGGHGSDDRFYKQRYDAKVWAVEGQPYFKGINHKKGEVYFQADGTLTADGELPVTGASLYVIDTELPEGLMLIPAGGGTLISGDALQNWGGSDEYFNWLSKLVMGGMGFLKPHNLGPGWIKTLKPKAESMRGILDLAFDNVLPGHGAAVMGDAKEKYRPVIERYVAKAT